MNPIKTLIVGLDLSEMDDLLIHYASYVKQFLPDINTVVFVHNIKFDYPELAKELLQSLDKPLGEELSEAFLEKVDQHFKLDKGEVEVVIEEQESTAQALADVAQQYDAPLLLAGKKISYPGSGRMVETLLRLQDFEGALLLLPETAYHQIQQILVPTDFSQASIKAIKQGAYFRKRSGASLQCQHVFSVPAHYFPYIVIDNVEEKLQKKAEKEWKPFSKKLTTEHGVSEIACALTFSGSKNIAQTIYDFALREKKDLIVISTKGRGVLSPLLIGSVAIRLIQLNMHVPLMVVK